MQKAPGIETSRGTTRRCAPPCEFLRICCIVAAFVVVFVVVAVFVVVFVVVAAFVAVFVVVAALVGGVVAAVVGEVCDAGFDAACSRCQSSRQGPNWQPAVVSADAECAAQCITAILYPFPDPLIFSTLGSNSGILLFLRVTLPPDHLPTPVCYLICF